jgi:hypothetical protein
MADYKTYDPRDFTTEELVQAARGQSARVPSQTAPALLHAKLGTEAQPVLTALAADEYLDARVRHFAVRELARIPTAAPVLERLAASPEPLVASAASEAIAGGGAPEEAE